jgi:serine phosphatase RsbU (regulator of sigma subunit)
VLISPSAIGDPTPYTIDSSTPIISSDKNNVVVLEDSIEGFSAQQVVLKLDQFKSASTVKSIDYKKRYWISQSIANKLDYDNEFTIDAAGVGWSESEHFLIDHDGSIKALNPGGILTPNYNHVTDLAPFVSKPSDAINATTTLRIPKNTSVHIISRLKSHRFSAGRSFSLNIIDTKSFLEIRRYGLYLQGAMLGILFALVVFSWYSVYQYRDWTSFAYGVWLISAFCSAGTLRLHDSAPVWEFFVDAGTARFGTIPLATAWTFCFAYMQSCLYIIFARSFLDFKNYFPKFYNITTLFVIFAACHGLTFIFFEVDLPTKIFVLIYAIPLLVVLASIYVFAFKRLQQGLNIAKFFMFAMIPYFTFRAIFVLGIAGLPSPFAFFPESGFGFFFRNNSVNQLMGLCSEALIMALAVISRTRWMQQELATSIKSQKDLVENQNRVLEATVTQRTQELEAQHKELAETHQLVVGSVNYASRLQRGLLPRQVRLENRFLSFDAVWEPRDTIGGDLWWVSSSQHTGPFVLALADCTGHGVPGAMLSMLVSNSLERIYANDTTEDPASALMSLDHYVRSGLNQDRSDSESDDGCDAAILRIDRQNHLIDFAGAKIGLYQITKHGQITRHSSSRISLGYQELISEQERPVLKTIKYTEEDLFVIVTDGLTDQVGGTASLPVSFGYRRLEKLLVENCHLPAVEIANKIKISLRDWQDKQIRRDDVTAVIFRL